MEEQDLFSMLDSAGDAAFVVDRSGLIRYWSPKAVELLGFRKEQALLKNCAQLLGGQDEAGADVCCRDCRVLELASQRGQVAAYDLHAVTASGQRRWVNVSILVARPNRGRSILVVHLMRDAERRKQTEMVTRDILVSVGRLTGVEADRILERGVPSPPAVELTAQEKTILRLLSLGRNPNDIAEQLHISRATVRNHLQHILGKLDCHTRLDAVLRAVRERLI